MLALLTALTLLSAPDPVDGTHPTVALIVQQAEDWNRGDLAAFTKVYSVDASFVSPSGLTKGRAAILARYEKKYDTKEKRGVLKMEPLELSKAPGGQAASMLLKWTITRGKETLTGHALIVLHKTADGWTIVQDASM